MALWPSCLVSSSRLTGASRRTLRAFIETFAREMEAKGRAGHRHRQAVHPRVPPRVTPATYPLLGP